MRNYSFDIKYLKFRRAVKRRDRYCCQWPNCKEKKDLQVHHIIKWADNISQRYNIRNGITLCRKHHLLIKDKEYCYLPFLRTIVDDIYSRSRHKRKKPVGVRRQKPRTRRKKT